MGALEMSVGWMNEARKEGRKEWGLTGGSQGGTWRRLIDKEYFPLLLGTTRPPPLPGGHFCRGRMGHHLPGVHWPHGLSVSCAHTPTYRPRWITGLQMHLCACTATTDVQPHVGHVHESEKENSSKYSLHFPMGQVARHHSTFSAFINSVNSAP